MENPKNIKGSPERIEFLKEIIQRQYDHENWYGQDLSWKQNQLMCIAAGVELLSMGIIFKPSYTLAV